MKIIHNIEEIRFDGPLMHISVDGRKYDIDLSSQSQKLAESPASIKNNYMISPSGYGIYWPDIEEDLSIDGLLGITHKVKSGRRNTVRK